MMTNRTALLGVLGALLLGSCGKDDNSSGRRPGSQQDAAPAVVDSKSYFIVNEDIFGRQNGTVNRIWFDGNITYRAYRKANSGAQLGVTTQFATVYGGNIYFVSKQGGRFVVADAATLHKKASFSQIRGDGRACVGVDERTMYVSTSSGIEVFDIASLRFTGHVDGVDSDQGLYTEQAGDMVRIGNRVFAAMQGRGILVIDTRTHAVEQIIEPRSTGGLCQSRNGWLWIAGNPLKAYDPYTLRELKSIDLPSEDKGGGVEWGTWRSCSLCASTQNDAIYWLGRNPATWGQASGVLRYDIAKEQLTPVMELKTYGTIRIDPLTDYITTVDGTLYDHTGKLQREITILGGMPGADGSVDESQPNPYWFSTLPVFEDVNRPAILTNRITLPQGKTGELCLNDMIVDHDNSSCSILKEVVFEPNTLVEHEIHGDLLRLRGISRGETSFLLKVNSNGFTAEKRIALKIE